MEQGKTAGELAVESLAKLAINPENTQDWVRCSRCKAEVHKRAVEQSVCAECRHKEADALKRKQVDQEVIRETFGGEKALSTFRFDTFFAQPNQELPISTIRKFDPRTQNLYVFGPCGVGKTHLVVARAKELYLAERLKRETTLMYFKPPRLMRKMRGFENSWDEDRYLETLAKVDILIIDDLGVGRATEFSLQILYEILDMRDMKEKNGLILTSNLPLDELARLHNDDRLASRIAGLCQIVQLPGEDYRERMAKVRHGGTQ